MKNTFRGGVHPISHKELTRDVPLRVLNAKGEMVFPLLQHIGKPAKPLVKKGDEVLAGQKIGEADGLISAHVISSCSGKVKAVEKRRVQNGQMVECIVVDNDGQYSRMEGIGVRQDISSLSKEEILRRIREAGIVGLGGAGFPTHVKLSPKNPDAIRYVIANGSECEPYLTGTDQLMRSQADSIAEGLSLMLRLFPNAEGVIVIEDNKPEAIEAMRKASAGNDKLSVLAAKAKYGQGGEKMLIETVAGINYPSSMLPAEVGCIVQNACTIYAIDRAVAYLEPLFTHTFTLTGDAVKTPGNFIVRDGMSFSELIEAAGGLKEGAVVKKAIVGGPIMGIAIPNLDVPIQKTSSGVALVTVDQSEVAASIMTSCLRCGRCTTVCPVGLLPQMLADAVQAGDLERYEKKLYGLECIQCGCCSYICPAKRPLTQTFMRTKAEILAQKRAAVGGKK
ncbi:MAG: electron transport complex subunit RsxC [Oscillospiraceae bacterium]|nr:electron transport complex subunit RsxC [Oscillospiraceae bacterium]